jgi:hypothetical protein
MDYIQKIAITAAAGAVTIFGMTGAVTALHSAAVARHAHTAACSATEDSYLTDCHGRRLDYAHGQWTVQTFNDGFTDAKRDDCQQGSMVACMWLQETTP